MPILPRKPGGLGGVKTAVDQLIDYCKSITPKSGKGITYAFDTDGCRAEVITNDFQPIDPPFWCVQVGKESVRVYDSKLVRNGTHLGIFNLEAGNFGGVAKNWATLTGFSTANETYYAYLELSNVGRTYHPALIPDKMEAKKALCSDGLFAGDNLANASGNKIKIVAKIWTGANGIYKIEQWPDRDDWVYIPDSWGVAALPGEKPVSASLDLRPAGPDATDHTPQGYVLELKDFWAGLATDISRTLDMVEFRQGTDNGSGAPTEPYTQKYCTVAKLSNVMDPSEIGGGTINTIIEYIGDNIGDIVTYLSGELPHTDLDFTAFGAIGTGESGGNTDHDDSYHHSYNDGTTAAGHVNYVDAKSFRTTGEYWASAVHIDPAGTGTAGAQYWTADDFLVKVNTSAILKPATDNTRDLTFGDNGVAEWKNIYTYAYNWIQDITTEWQLNSGATCNVYFGKGIGAIKSFNIQADGATDSIVFQYTGNFKLNGKKVTSKRLSDVSANEKVLVIET